MWTSPTCCWLINQKTEQGHAGDPQRTYGVWTHDIWSCLCVDVHCILLCAMAGFIMLTLSLCGWRLQWAEVSMHQDVLSSAAHEEVCRFHVLLQVRYGVDFICRHSHTRLKVEWPIVQPYLSLYFISHLTHAYVLVVACFCSWMVWKYWKTYMSSNGFHSEIWVWPPPLQALHQVQSWTVMAGCIHCVLWLLCCVLLLPQLASRLSHQQRDLHQNPLWRRRVSSRWHII